MRPLEAVLITANLISLLLLCRRLSKRTWVGIAGVNGLMLLLHGGLESFRYQMAFSYILALLLVISGWAVASGKAAKVQVPRWLKGLTICVGMASLALTAVIAYVLPVFTLPRPTGSYTIGIKYFHLTDANRADPFLAHTARKRELMVKVYYPAKRDDTKPFSPYFHGSLRLLQAFAAFYQMPSFLFDHFRLVKTYAKDGLPLSVEQPSYPVVLFSNGAGTSMEVETSQSEDLASHGYIVVSIDHTYVSSATVFPGGIVNAHEATTDFKTPEPAEPITQIMTDDDKFVIEQLGEMNVGKMDPAFQGKLNIDEIGVIGHSVGGAVAYNMAINDRRVKAAINLDGTVYITPKHATAIAPFLMLANDRYHVQAIIKGQNLMQKFEATPQGKKELQAIYGSPQAYQTQYNKAQQNIRGLREVLKASGNLYTIEGSDHMKFTDIGLFLGNQRLRELLQIGGKTEPTLCLQMTQALTTAFFDHHLKGLSAEALTSIVTTYPKLKRVPLN